MKKKVDNFSAENSLSDYYNYGGLLHITSFTMVCFNVGNNECMKHCSMKVV